VPWLFLLLIPGLAALLWLYGFLAATLVWIVPFTKVKIRLARLLIVTPFRLIDRGLANEVATEVEWLVRMRHGKRVHRKQYAELLKEVWEDDTKHH
jgi:hypothetical protein